MPHGPRIDCQLGREMALRRTKRTEGHHLFQRRQEDFIIAHAQAFKGHAQAPNSMRLA